MLNFNLFGDAIKIFTRCKFSWVKYIDTHPKEEKHSPYIFYVNNKNMPVLHFILAGDAMKVLPYACFAGWVIRHLLSNSKVSARMILNKAITQKLQFLICLP